MASTECVHMHCPLVRQNHNTDEPGCTGGGEPTCQAELATNQQENEWYPCDQPAEVEIMPHGKPAALLCKQHHAEAAAEFFLRGIGFTARKL